MICEPQLGKRKLYPTLSTKESGKQVRTTMNLISYCDGQHSLLEISNLLNEPFWDLIPIVEKMIDNGLLSKETSES